MRSAVLVLLVLASLLLPSFVGSSAPPATMIVVHEEGRSAEALAALDALGVPRVDHLRVGMSVALLDAGQAARLARDPAVRGVWPDAPVTYDLDESTAMIGATQARAEHGLTGAGVGVFVIDSGIDTLHPDLDDRVAAFAHTLDPLGQRLVAAAPRLETTAPNDYVGHGTHVAGILVGTGEALGDADPTSGRIVGVAPGAHLVGYALAPTASFDEGSVADVVGGFEYLLAVKDKHNIRVSTNSWSFSGDPDAEDPVSILTQRAYQSGVAVVFSAGNSGAPGGGATTMGKHATLPWVLGVGAVEKSGALWDRSSRGRADGPVWEHPDLVAPGVGILSARSRASAFGAIGAAQAAFAAGDEEFLHQATHYMVGSGTSMAAPHVAGALALLFEANPELSPDQAYDILVRTADPMPGEVWARGAGLVNVSRAVALAFETPGELEAFKAGARKYDSDPSFARDPVREMLQEAPMTAAAPAAASAAPEPTRSVPAGAAWAALAVLGAVGAAARRR